MNITLFSGGWNFFIPPRWIGSDTRPAVLGGLAWPVVPLQRKHWKRPHGHVRGSMLNSSVICLWRICFGVLLDMHCWFLSRSLGFLLRILLLIFTLKPRLELCWLQAFLAFEKQGGSEPGACESWLRFLPDDPRCMDKPWVKAWAGMEVVCEHMTL